jgi:hypothetical protein
MEKNYSKKKKFANGPRLLVIRRILAFSKYYKQNKSELKGLNKKD